MYSQLTTRGKIPITFPISSILNPYLRWSLKSLKGQLKVNKTWIKWVRGVLKRDNKTQSVSLRSLLPHWPAWLSMQHRCCASQEQRQPKPNQFRLVFICVRREGWAGGSDCPLFMACNPPIHLFVASQYLHASIAFGDAQILSSC